MTCLKEQLLKEGFAFIYLADTFIQKTTCIQALNGEIF